MKEANGPGGRVGFEVDPLLAPHSCGELCGKCYGKFQPRPPVDAAAAVCLAGCGGGVRSWDRGVLEALQQCTCSYVIKETCFMHALLPAAAPPWPLPSLLAAAAWGKLSHTCPVCAGLQAAARFLHALVPAAMSPWAVPSLPTAGGCCLLLWQGAHEAAMRLQRVFMQVSKPRERVGGS